MKEINLTSDRVRLPSSTIVPPSTNRALTKLQLPFPGFNFVYRLGRENIPAIAAFGKKDSNPIFSREFKKAWKEKGVRLKREMVLRC